MLSWVLEAVESTKPERIMVVVGHGAEGVVTAMPEGVEWCVQDEQNGTGHAAQIALAALGPVSGMGVMVLPGDTPLVTGEALGALVAHHGERAAGVTMLTAVVDDPTGYGRIVRDADGVTAIVEHHDADDLTREINEINAGMYIFDGDTLAEDLAALEPENTQSELYVTDVVGKVARRGQVVAALVVEPDVVAGINTHVQLARANAVARERIIERLMLDGVSVLDPDRTYIDADVVVEPGAVIYPGCHLEGRTHVAAASVVGPDSFLENAIVGPKSRVSYSVVRNTVIGAGCEVGPYASLRNGVVLKDGAKAGTFVELKKTTVGEGSKVPHLSYMGDATIGSRSNVGAGSITCNYDGRNKHETHIGDDAFIGSSTMLVAPVDIGDGAFTGAGSVITNDVPAGDLGIERSHQRNIDGYAARRAERYRSAGAEADKEP
jgi:bifunctional UDP-N-acetylglucosamine pyrophosphorylase/glucosamine-1-phosphate N-acetyltransferase